MKRFLVPAVFTTFVSVVFAILAPLALAQAPAPKVTLNGLFDQVTSAGRNFYDGDLTRDNDREWYARTRFRPDFTFEVGRVKAVLGLEIDIGWGQMGANDGGFPGNTTGANQCKVNSNGCFDLNTDVGGMIEIKWMYTEFPLTGKDSVLPFIPVETMARAGAQPFASLANYKIVYANGDFAGVSAITRFTPDFRTNLAYAIIEDQLAGGNRAAATARTSRGEDYAFIVSPEITPFKGLDIKPLFSWLHADGVTASAARHHVVDRRFAGGANTTTNSGASLGGGNAAGDSTFHEDRYTIGFDARWRSGPFGFEPTIYYQWGQRDHMAVRTNGTVGKVEADMSSWIVDLIGSFQTGPLLLEVRGAYSPGNKARDNLARSVRYFQQLDEDGNYWNNWAALLANGGIDYFNGTLLTNMGRHIGYDRYGRAALGFKATYSITPALAVYTWVSPNWTAEKVDTDTGAGAGTGASAVSRTTLDDQSWVEGDSRYLGTEIDIGTTWRFAPNAAFDLQGAYLFAGEALGTAEVLSGVHTRRDPNDGYMIAARVRFAF
ncbi:MAG TPA: hypothetical protein VET45_04895 [Candidatus Binatia bacterium]|nr:hypothetical protein [Candidatus Binatia bacterium]